MSVASPFSVAAGTAPIIHTDEPRGFFPIPLNPDGTDTIRPMVDPNRLVLTEAQAVYLHPRSKKQTVSKRILRRDYNDSSVGYKCRDCDYENVRFHSTFAHLGKHSEGRVEKISASNKARHEANRTPVKQQIIDLLDQMETVDARMAKVISERDDFRRRMQEAEAQVRKMRNAFKSLMPEDD